MQAFRLTAATLCSAALATAFSAGVAAASTMVVDRGLPNQNLNNAAGGDRSNVAWGSAGFQAPGDIVYGDSFSLGPTGDAGNPSWSVDRLTAWFTAGSDGDTDFEVGSLFSSMSLFLGPLGGIGSTIGQVASSAITGNSADSPNVEINRVSYANDEGYQGSGGGFLQIWQIDFFNVGNLAPGDYMFGIGAGQTATDLADAVPFSLHASNALLGGVDADDANDTYLDFDLIASGTELQLFAVNDSDGFGWDKSSDINVQVWATPIPLPAAGWLLLGGLGALGFAARRKRKMVA